jgi:hypothetical protein
MILSGSLPAADLSFYRDFEIRRCGVVELDSQVSYGCIKRCSVLKVAKRRELYYLRTKWEKEDDEEKSAGM